MEIFYSIYKEIIQFFCIFAQFANKKSVSSSVRFILSEKRDFFGQEGADGFPERFFICNLFLL